jgi:hypothetical protein
LRPKIRNAVPQLSSLASYFARKLPPCCVVCTFAGKPITIRSATKRRSKGLSMIRRRLWIRLFKRATAAGVGPSIAMKAG